MPRPLLAPLTTPSTNHAHAKCNPARIGSIEVTEGSSTAARSARRPPSSPPTVPPAAMRPIAFLAVRGSNLSLMIDQNPEMRTAPSPEKWRYTSTDTGPRKEATKNHSTSRSTALDANAIGTRRPGPTRVNARVATNASSTETTAAPTTIRGSIDTSKLDRKSALRVAFAAIWKAIITVAITVAAVTAARVSWSGVMSVSPRVRYGRDLERTARVGNAFLSSRYTAWPERREPGHQAPCQVRL